MNIRKLKYQDLTQVNEIYNWHSINGIATFSEPTSIVDRQKWFLKFDSPEHLAFVAEKNNQIAGVCCSFAYRGGGVFKNTIETSIYLHHQYLGRGIGSQLYQKLFDELPTSKAHRVVVGIALPNDASIKLHKKFNFEEIGIFDEYAFYKGEYRSSIWLQKRLK